MIYSFHKDVETSAYWFGNCCGATLTKKEVKNPRSALKGIRVFNGKVGIEFTGPKNLLKHIETRNGNLTISVRTAR